MKKNENSKQTGRGKQKGNVMEGHDSKAKIEEKRTTEKIKVVV